MKRNNNDNNNNNDDDDDDNDDDDNKDAVLLVRSRVDTANSKYLKTAKLISFPAILNLKALLDYK